jgi:NAD(P)-dependent dehydrogenase (short-subunit alcohol dehydrogenase family)
MMHRPAPTHLKGAATCQQGTSPRGGVSNCEIGTVLFLGSDDARYITGASLPVDAGQFVK